ncbi:MAG: hypothetical protein CR993_00730 [Rhodobacterales bacterium]|nr:MAG: hypothetical protein CR993_00730 [Rhodobacterales bacterium]
MRGDAPASAPARHLWVYPAEAFRVSHGVNEGDPISEAAQLVFEDIYMLSPGAAPEQLALSMAPRREGAFAGSYDRMDGAPAPIFLDSLLTFMAPDGNTLEALIFVELEPQSGHIAQVWLHPFGPLTEKTPYTLVKADTDAPEARLAAAAMVAFTRGTHITLADGRQTPIEALQPGDMVLTRDSGPQPLRWIGLKTLRATGPFAPITIAPGVLNNEHALVVSPGHRLFIYQRTDGLGTGRKELLIKAELLVNGTTVTQEPGGFVDYFQLLFDKHEIIYAEGIAAESLFLDRQTRPGLPNEVAERLAADHLAGSTRNAHEVKSTELGTKSGDTVQTLRRLSAY